MMTPVFLFGGIFLYVMIGVMVGVVVNDTRWGNIKEGPGFILAGVFWPGFLFLFPAVMLGVKIGNGINRARIPRNVRRDAAIAECEKEIYGRVLGNENPPDTRIVR